MANLNSAIKRIQNKGKKSVDPKKNEMAEVAPVVAKGAAMVGKAAKVAAKASKPVAKNLRFKRPNIRSYKNPETGKVDMDRYRSDQAKYKKIQQDKKNRPDMSDVKPDGTSDDRTKRGERKLKAIDKVTDKKKEAVKQGLQTTGNVAKGTAKVAGKVTGKVVKGTAQFAKTTARNTVRGFGRSSFSYESKITFKEYLNKL
tara:strand:- start:250 stop:849 length:600 start_codon:yes stop_codon:yes gene_type:complete